MTQQEILTCLQQLLPLQMLPRSKAEMSQHIKELEQKELITRPQNSTCHQPLIRQMVLQHTLEEGLFTKYTDCLEPIYQKKTPSWKWTYYSVERGLFLLQGALFKKDAPLNDLEHIRNKIYNDFGQSLSGEPLFLVLGAHPAASLLRLTSHPQWIVTLLLEGAIDKGRTEPELASLLLELLKTSPMGGAPNVLIDYLIFTGNMGAALEVLNLDWPANLDYQWQAAQGFLFFVQGDYASALLSFNSALTHYRKLTGKRKVALHHYPGIAHLCCLLAAKTLPQAQLGIDLATIANKNSLLPTAFLDNIQGLFTEQSGQTYAKIPRIEWHALKQYPVYRFFFLLSLWWLRRDEVLDTLPNLCENMLHRAQEDRYPWLAAELASLLTAMGYKSDTYEQLATDLHRQCKTVSCVGIVQHEDKSIQRLNALLALAGSLQGTATSSQGIQSSQRLIWWLTFHKNTDGCTLQPILQKLGKNGAWSKGRNVALKALYDGAASMDGLTDQDLAICKTLRYQQDYYSSHDTLRIDIRRALHAAVGHPHLYLAAPPHAQIDLSLGKIELRISKKKDSLAIQLWPNPGKHGDTSFLIRESPTSFKFYLLDENQKKLIALLKENLVLPAAVTDQVRELASSLSTVVTVHSDVGGGEAALEIPVDPQPHIHLLPFQDGLRAEILVRPLGEKGTWHQPGKGMAIILGEQEGKKLQAKRDLNAEKKQRDQLVSACPALQHAENEDNQYLFPDPADSLELLHQLQQHQSCPVHWPRGQSFTLRREAGFANLGLTVKKDRDWFAASGSLHIDENTILDLQELLGLLDKGHGRFIPLKDGSFLALTRSLQKRLEELRAYSESTKEGTRFNPLATLALDDLFSQAKVSGDRQWKMHTARLSETIHPKLPSTFQATLRDYQLQGFSWLAQLSHWQTGACLADDMGLGKTVQALAAILLRADQGPTLVVAPLSVAANWVNEAATFAPTLTVKVFGPGDRQEMLDTLGPFDLLVSSYGLLQMEGEKLAKVQWQTVVLDEAQAIKNRQTKRAKAAMSLQARFRLVTTGTPLENHLGELWTIFHFINPGLLGSHQRFTETFTLPIERDNDRNRLQQLQRLIRPFILRRMKNEVLHELPAKTEITLQVEMSDEEAALYEAQRQHALQRLEKEGTGNEGQQHLRILAEIMKLRRLCCNPSLILPDSPIASSKLKVFGDILTELLENRHKALVFSQFIDHLSILRSFLDRKNIAYQYLDGGTTAAQRQERITAFQAGQGDVFLISLKAGGSGLNLTAADYVIHMDPWWNPAVEDQASDRAHRIGQERPVTVYRLVMKNSIEEQIVGLHKDKRDLADSLLNGADAAGRLSANELLGLLRDTAAGRVG